MLMGKINLHITNSNQFFTDEDIVVIKKASASAEEFISKRFSFDYEVDLVVTFPTFLMRTIPEDGITGRTYNSRLIILVLDKNQKPVNEENIFETIVHEMSHSLRWEKLPEYSDTLFKGMILEGLAITLEEQAVGDKAHETQYFLMQMKETSDDEYRKMIKTLRPLFDMQEYEYETIFYTGNESLPRWAGYRLGYYYVKRYMQRTGRSIEEATLDSYELFSYE